MAPQKETRFADFLKEENIIAGLPAIGGDGCITHLTELLLRNEGGFEKDAAITAVIDREKVSPTVVAPGIAFPHARLEKIPRPLVAVATSSHGIDFKAEDREPVNVVVLTLTPKADPSAYLRFLAAASNVLGAPRMRSRLAVCTTAAQVYGILTEDTTALPPYLTAGNMMDRNPLTLSEGDTLARTIEAFCTHRVTDIPVVDEEHDLRGVVAIEDILHMSLPRHLLWMEDLTSILRFEPFAEVLRKDSETKVADFMREKYASIQPDTPAIQLARIFLMRNVRQILVLDGRRLVGVVNLDSFIAQLFWA
ncbi:MAG: PTS sugar transporter subunit IIA [Kiritimatiellae bacterium]|nr:PTS sugar transporter subunit IIA [Kiritimatiellia bacterium]